MATCTGAYIEEHYGRNAQDLQFMGKRCCDHFQAREITWRLKDVKDLEESLMGNLKNLAHYNGKLDAFRE